MILGIIQALQLPADLPFTTNTMLDTILYYTILYYTILYYTVLYNTVLYYILYKRFNYILSTILFFTALSLSSPISRPPEEPGLGPGAAKAPLRPPLQEAAEHLGGGADFLQLWGPFLWSMVWYYITWHNITWYGMVWSGMVQYAWYNMLYAGFFKNWGSFLWVSLQQGP